MINRNVIAKASISVGHFAPYGVKLYLRNLATFYFLRTTVLQVIVNWPNERLCTTTCYLIIFYRQSIIYVPNFILEFCSRRIFVFANCFVEYLIRGSAIY